MFSVEKYIWYPVAMNNNKNDINNGNCNNKSICNTKNRP